MMTSWVRAAVVVALAVVVRVGCAAQQVHGMWVWKSPDVLATPQGAERLRDFCKAQGINEVYVSYSAAKAPAEEKDFVHLIELLHHERVRVEALISSIDADEPGSRCSDKSSPMHFRNNAGADEGDANLPAIGHSL